ncbi:LysR family transcriptional regulator [Aureimonas flava]|uniref:LysR family transcriptional regulator n=1 Tax=Aureimonas flava TaxID=2320271 RepID=A0A3A1WLZ3_9HYPH|nr:LysR family transcriptional regulator [Aureimonas flava]RIY02577.1 LysR family transcriptional regulator [Aureimonas flava]
MNIEALRSFLDVADSGSFSVAAKRTGVTQSTVSARIQSLEDHLGARLMHRGRSGVELTPAGRQFRVHADRIVRIWTQARMQATLPEGYDGIFRLGGPVSIEEWLSLSWTLWMKRHAPTVAVHLEAGTSAALCERLAARDIDAAVMYLPQQRPGLVVEELLREELALVRHRDLAGDWMANYIDVDWGPEFRTVFRQAFPRAAAPSLSVGLGVLGMQYVMALKGAGYLPLGFAAAEIERGILQLVEDAPRVHRPVYLVYPAQAGDAALVEMALDGLRRVAANRGAVA